MTIEDRTEISTGLMAGWSITTIAGGLGRAESMISPEIRRNSTATEAVRHRLLLVGGRRTPPTID